MEQSDLWQSELLETAKLELRQREIRIAQLERQLEIAQAELEVSQSRAGELEKICGSLEERTASLTISLEELREQLALSARASGQLDHNTLAFRRMEDLNRAELARLEAENRNLSVVNDEQARRIRALDQIIDGYAASNARIRSEYEKLRQQGRR